MIFSQVMIFFDNKDEQLNESVIPQEKIEKDIDVTNIAIEYR